MWMQVFNILFTWDCTLFLSMVYYFTSTATTLNTTTATDNINSYVVHAAVCSEKDDARNSYTPMMTNPFNDDDEEGGKKKQNL